MMGTAEPTVHFSELKAIGTYLDVRELRPIYKRRTKRWGVYTRGGILLGEVRWYSRWRQYSFFPEPETVFNRDCMDDLAKFLKQVKGERV